MAPPHETAGRTVTLVVVDDLGSVQGASEPIAIELPWWQEVWPLADAVPGITVLRLLDADPSRQSGGPVTYLAETTEEARANLSLSPWNGTIDTHPLRHPWAAPGGPAADLAWVSTQVTITGPPRQHRTWNLSAIWSIQTEGDRGQPETVWLKCVPDFFIHEAAVLQVLGQSPQAAQALPQLVATDAHRLLLAAMPGEDGYRASVAEQMEMIDTLVDIQLIAATAVDQLLQNGVPDQRSDALAADLEALVERLAPDREPLRRLADELSERLATAAECGIPDTLVHGDPHAGNCRRDVDPPVWFDWGDSFIGNPLLDLATTHRMGDDAVDHWINRWSAEVSGADLSHAIEALQPVATLRMAAVYQRFLDNIEPTEWIYHRKDVPEMLNKAEAQM